MKRLIAAGIFSGALFLVGCSSGGYGTVTGQADTTSFNGNPGGSTPPAAPSSSTAVFRLATGQLPYPTDLYFAGSADGTLNIQPPNALWPNQPFVNHLDGFSTTAVIREQFGGPLDPTTFTASSIIIVPVVTDNLTKATTGFLGGTPHPLVPGTDYTAALATDTGVGPQILEITPLHPLLPSTCISPGPPPTFLGANCKTGTGYLVILTNGIKDKSGNAAVPDTDYANIKAALAGGPTCPSITDKTLNGLCQLTGAHLALAGALGVNPANVVLTFSFTTQGTLDTLELISATTAPQPIKLNPTGITTAQAHPGLPGHANLYVGVLTIPYYLSKAQPVTGWWQAPPFPLDTTSTNVTRFNPLPVPTDPHLLIPLLVTVPNASSTHGATPPPGGWPVVIFEHGVLRNREDMLAVADSFADAGFVVAAIDLPLHGVTNTKDPLYASAANPLYMGLGLPTTQMSIERTFDLDINANNGNFVVPGTPPDGVIDPTGAQYVLALLQSPLTFRDNVRESVADLITFERSLPNMTVSGAPINKAQIHYVGHSGGAIVGGIFMGVIPSTDVSTATLGNAGGQWSLIAQTSPYFSAQALPILEAQGLLPGTTLFAQYFRDVQTIVDSGDPINYIALATAQHPIHLLQVVGSTPPPAGCNPLTPPNGCPDQVVPNPSTRLLITASAYGPGGAATALTRIPAPAAPGPLVNPSGFRAYVNFIEGDHGSLIDGLVPLVTAEMQGEAISFAGSNGQELFFSVPSVIQP